MNNFLVDLTDVSAETKTRCRTWPESNIVNKDDAVSPWPCTANFVEVNYSTLVLNHLQTPHIIPTAGELFRHYTYKLCSHFVCFGDSFILYMLFLIMETSKISGWSNRCIGYEKNFLRVIWSLRTWGCLYASGSRLGLLALQLRLHLPRLHRHYPYLRAASQLQQMSPASRARSAPATQQHTLCFTKTYT